MKTLYLIRHAKSDWNNPLLSDFNRPLSQRGENDVILIGKELKEKNINPDIIFSSPAKRVKQTITTICKEINYQQNKIIYEQSFFDFHTENIDYFLGFIIEINNKYNSAFLVGHNNVWSELASFLIGRNIGLISTCGVISITFNTDSWDEIGYGSGKKEFYIYPKQYK